MNIILIYFTSMAIALILSIIAVQNVEENRTKGEICAWLAVTIIIGNIIYYVSKLI